ncbi:MAG: YbaB/EbfC family DNA-binding protein [Mycobacterium sp.]
MTHGGDDHDDLAALDFSSAEAEPADSQAYDMDFGTDDYHDPESGLADLDEYAPAEAQETVTVRDIIDSQTGDADEHAEDDVQMLMFTVTNPPGTVSVSSLMDGRIQQIDLAPAVSTMTESQLAEEIRVIADLARLKGLAGQYAFITTMMYREELHNGTDVRAVLEQGLELPSPQQADEAQADVFASRYSERHG